MSQTLSLTDIDMRMLCYGVPHAVSAQKAPFMGWLCCRTLRLTGGPLTDRPVEAVVSRRWFRGSLRDLLPTETEVFLREHIGGIQGMLLLCSVRAG